MIRLTELKLPLEALPVEHRRAANAPAETEADRTPTPHPIEALRTLAAQALQLQPADIAELQVFKRSFDARKAQLQAVFIVDIGLAEGVNEAQVLARFAGHPHILPTPDMAWHAPAHASAEFGASAGERPVVVGFGPCGMFAALTLAQMGFKPIVIERGTRVRQRTKDTWGLWRKHTLKPESNVQFGEGGAGTFSDGKLYSQIKDPRFLGRKVMHEFVQAGAPADILFEAHPHIGTFKLVKVVENIREQIIALGGEIRFEERLVGLSFTDENTPKAASDIAEPLSNSEQTNTASVRHIQALHILQADGQRYTLPTRHVVLALGHSSRDTFAMLWDAGVAMQSKPFSVGVRIEHPQGLIDRARWGRHAGHPLLGAADYKLVHHAKNGRAVYSFCMCPGGTVVAATSEPGRVVTNGMSQYSRNERNANAGIVVGIDPPDFLQLASNLIATDVPPGSGAPDGTSTPNPPAEATLNPHDPIDRAGWIAAFGDTDGARYANQAAAMARMHPPQYHPLSGVVLQRRLESRAYVLGGGTYESPGQLVGDFIRQQPSAQFGEVLPSYKPGVKLGSLAAALPTYAVEAMREALPVFGKKIKGFDLDDAVLTGVETRTSSPLRITRRDNYQSSNVNGLYPAGEGAGFAGGILSAGVDGIKVAEALALAITA